VVVVEMAGNDGGVEGAVDGREIMTTSSGTVLLTAQPITKGLGPLSLPFVFKTS
jgi:hypothetical protein